MSVFDNNTAFRQAFSDVVTIKSGTLNVSLKVCVFESSAADPISGEALDSDVLTLACVIRDSDWHHFAAINRAMTITFEGRDYKVTSAKRHRVMGYVVYARSVN